MLKVENLNFSFNKDTIIFDDCSFEIKDNKKTVIVGLNGTGKTTLFKLITKELKTNCKINSTFKNIFYLAQNISCPRYISAFDYLSSIYFKNNFKWFIDKTETKKILETLDYMGLLAKKDIFCNELSGGEFQKLNLALALLSGADLLLLDEPVSNLDLINQIEVMRVIKNLNTTTVVILHDLNYASELGDEFIAINNKKIIQKEKEDFFNPQNLKNVFNIDFKVLKEHEKYIIQIDN